MKSRKAMLIGTVIEAAGWLGIAWALIEIASPLFTSSEVALMEQVLKIWASMILLAFASLIDLLNQER
jgi:hypothetical protein